MFEWRNTTLGEFIGLQRGHDLPERARIPGNVPVVGSGGITGWHDNAKVPGPGITIGRAANLGSPTLIQEDFWPLNTTLYVTDFRGNDVRFTYYLLRILDLTGFNSGSVQPMLNRNYIREFPIRVPDHSGQESISDLLGALDDKIAVNDRMSETSNQLIHIFYRKAIADESDEAPLLDAFNITFGAPFSSKSFNEEERGRPLIRIRDIKTHAPQIWTTEHHSKETVVQPGDTIAGMDAEFRPGFWLGEPALLNQRVLHVRSRSGGGSALCREALGDPLRRVESYKTGTTVAHLNKNDLLRISVRLPTKSLLEWFESNTSPLHRKIVAGAQDSRTLERLRDVLLPRLMSGEIRIRDAERVVEEAT